LKKLAESNQDYVVLKGEKEGLEDQINELNLEIELMKHMDKNKTS